VFVQYFFHIWTSSSSRIALSPHLVVEGFEQWPGVLAEAKNLRLHQGVTHVVLQPESGVYIVRWLRVAAELSQEEVPQ